MREVGLVVVEADARGQVGRPQHRYSLAADAPSLGLEPPVMPVLAKMVLSMAERLNASPDDAAAVGRDEGLRRSVPYSAAPSALEAVVSDLDRLGFDPVVTDGADDTAVVAFAHCPFGELAEQHPHLVCSLHRGLIAGFAAGMGDADLVEFCSVADRTPCQATLR
jgi:predicted ArsR family transcriptional regulator